MATGEKFEVRLDEDFLSDFVLAHTSDELNGLRLSN